MINFTTAYHNLPNTTIDERLSIVFNPVTRPLSDWRTEVLTTAKFIADSSSNPIMVSLSGGIDAEVAARAFLELKVPFEVFSIRHKQGTNDYDIDFARLFCKTYNIKHHIHEIDYAEFWTTGIQKYIDQGYRASTLFRFLQLLILDTINSLGYTAVLGSGDQQYKTVNNQICLPLSPTWAQAVDWCKNNNAVHYPYFFMSNPEVFASYMKIALVDLKLKDPSWFVNTWDNASLEKQDIYHRYWNEMPRRNKTDGFNKMRQWKIKRESELKLLYPDIVNYMMPVDTIKQQLGIS
jgi:hypothetical protein